MDDGVVPTFPSPFGRRIFRLTGSIVSCSLLDAPMTGLAGFSGPPHIRFSERLALLPAPLSFLALRGITRQTLLASQPFYLPLFIPSLRDRDRAIRCPDVARRLTR